MAEQGRREVVSDQLAFNAREQLPDRSLATVGVRNPGQSGGGSALAQQQLYGLKSLGALSTAVQGVVAQKNDDAIVEGKINFMQGMSEADIIATGNKYTRQGYETLNSVDKSNTWYLSELNNMDELRKLSPEEYKKHIMDSRAAQLDSLPDDPAVRKVYAAAFEQTGPRLAAEHMQAHNAYLEVQGKAALSGAISSASGANPDATRVMPGGSLRVSPSVVDSVYQGNDADREYGILTMLGEANGEGDVGLAAVAHVIKNRTMDKRWGGSVKDVVLSPKQFSTWNAGPGGNNPGRFRGSRAYEKAAAIYDAVMSGHTVDPTNGATHYYSPRGMDKLVADGDQNNRVPTWLAQEEAKSGRISIGGHIFVGKASGAGRIASAVSGQSPAGARQVPTSAEYEALGLGAYANEGRDRGNYGGAPSTTKAELQVTDATDPNAVSEAEGIPVAPVRSSTMVRKLLDASNLKPEAKASVLADTLRRQLDEGTDQLFNDIGGVGVLYDLGASAGDIDEVTKAKARFDKKQDDKFDVDRERAVSDVISNVKAGKFNSVREATDAVEELYNAGAIDDKRATSLFRQVQDAWTKSNVEKVIPIEARSAVSALYTELEDGTITEADAGRAVLEIGERFGLEDTVINNFIGSMFAEAKSQREQARTKAETEYKKVQKETVLKEKVESALSADKPIDDIDGTVRVKDDIGNEIEVNAKEYAIRLLKDKEGENVRAMVQSGQMDEKAAPAAHLKAVYEKMARIGLVDEEHGRELQAAVRGNIAPKGVLNEDAKQAFDEYLQLVKNPNIGPDYVAKMIPDQYVRSLFKTAELNDAGRFGIEESLLRAHEQLQRRDFNPEERIVMTDAFRGKLAAGMETEIDNAIARPGWFGGFATRPSEIEALTDKTGRAYTFMKQFVEAQANIYHVNNPAEDGEVSIKKAVEDLGRDLVIVGGNPMIGRSEMNQRLDQVMGLSSADKTLPQQAIDAYVAKWGPTFPGWGELFQAPKDLGVFTGTERTPMGEVGFIAPDKQVAPKYYATYNPSTGIVGVQLWSKDGKSLVGDTMYINAKVAGNTFKEQLRKPSAFATGLRTIKDAAVDLYQSVDFTTGLGDGGNPVSQ